MHCVESGLKTPWLTQRGKHCEIKKEVGIDYKGGTQTEGVHARWSEKDGANHIQKRLVPRKAVSSNRFVDQTSPFIKTLGDKTAC